MMMHNDKNINKRKRVQDDEDIKEFPRGGGNVLTPLEQKQIDFQATQDVLFERESFHKPKDSKNSEFEKIKRRKKSNRNYSVEKSSLVEGDQKTLKIESLNFKVFHIHIRKTSFTNLLKRLATGSLILGQVSEINEHNIALSLPNNLTGYVPITSISDKLTKRIELTTSEIRENESEKDFPEYTKLQEIFKIGQYLRAYVVSTGNELGANTSIKTKKRIELSLRPQDTNFPIDAHNIAVHSTLMASIVSVEDHGVILDLGLEENSIRGFMSSNEIGCKLKLSELKEGSVLLCIVTGLSSNGKIIKLSADEHRFSDIKKNCLIEAPTVKPFLPGTAVELLVTEINDRGIIGKIMGLVDVTADLIHSQAGGRVADLKSKYEVGSKVKGRLICTFQHSETPKLGISLLDHIVSYSQKKSTRKGETQDPLDIVPLSSILEKVTVIKVEPSIGLYVDLNIDGIPGFVHISRVSDEKIERLSINSGPYKLGSTHRGRLIDYNSFDGLYILSLQTSVINQPFLRISDLQIGGLVQGKVEKIVMAPEGICGLLVNLAEGITGLVPQAHISDIKLMNPEKKFRLGTAVKARVLSVDTSRRQIRLTLKKSLINSDAKQFLSYQVIDPRMQSPGTIINILPGGAVVQFYGNVRGFLPIGEMSEAYINDPSKHFQIGQVVNVHVLDVDPENERMTVSCKDPSIISIAQKVALKNLKIGEIVSAKVMAKSDEEIQVSLENNGLHAILPAGHLTDKANSKNLSHLKKIGVGTTLTDLAVIEIFENKRLIILTKKPSLVNDAKKNILIKSYQDLKLGAFIHGFVKNITLSSVFVQFGGGLTGLLPKTELLDENMTLSEFGMKKLQSVKVKVISLDQNQQRFKLSMRDFSTDCKFDNEPRIGMSTQELLNPIDTNIKDMSDFTVGKCTKARVTSVKDTQINVKLADNVNGRIDISQVFDSWDLIKDRVRPLRSFSTKQIIDVRILGTHDARNHCFLPFTHRSGTKSVFELSAKSSDQTESFLEAMTLEKIKIGTSWIVFVNNVTDDYLWVNLTPNIRGRIAALDASDDISLLDNLALNFPIGSALRAHVTNVNIASNRLDLSARSAHDHPISFDTLSIGMVVPGKVIKIDKRHLSVKFGDGLIGQVYLTDLADDFSKVNLTNYSKNDIIRVCVCDKNSSSQRITLSARPSRVLSSSLPIQDRDIISIEQLKVDDIVRGFIKNISEKGIFVSLSRNITAYVRISDLSDSYLKDWEAHFEIDQLVKGKVISVNNSLNQVQISLKSSILSGNYKPPVTFQSLKVGQFVTGRVRKVESYGIFIVIDGSENISGLCHKSELADKPVNDVQKLYEEGDTVQAVVLKLEPEKKRVNFGLKTSYFQEIGSESENESKNSNFSNRFIRETSELGVSSVEREGGYVRSNNENYSSVEVFSKKSNGVNITPKNSNDSISLKAGGFDWSVNIFDQDDNGSDQASIASEENQKLKKKNRKFETLIDKSGYLDVHEPCSDMDFERHLLGKPDSSLLWIQYIALQVRLGELEKAREIAERAIKTINITEETEKLNVWIALLNLENVYGNDDTAEEVFKRACQFNDAQEIYERYISILIQSGKFDVSFSQN